MQTLPTKQELTELLRYLTPQERAELDQLLCPIDERVAHDLPHWFNLLKIRTKGRKVIIFAPNAVQALYLDIICPGWRTEPVELRGLREILLKARQFGFSTLILALFFIDTITTPNTQTVVIAHDVDATVKLFRIIQRFYDSLPDDIKPPTKYANRREYLWPTLDSSFFVGTAGSGQFGRGGTINNVHGSEVAFWPNAKDIVAGLLEAVPEDGNVFLETTAFGFGNWYQTEYAAAMVGDSVFTDRFFAWFQHPEYRAKVVPADFERTEEETKLVAAYNLDDAQLVWRRGKVKVLRDKFPQEYPATPEEAFLTSGNPYFDRDYLTDLTQQLKSSTFDPIVKPDIPKQFEKLRTLPANEFSVWDLPADGRLYVISADTAEGINDDGDHDFDAADVFDAETWTQVAHLHGRWDTHKYGLLLAELGFWYNIALLGIERNNHGHAVINAALYTANYPEASTSDPHGMYYHLEYDEKQNITGKKPGWPTTPKTKYFALDGLATSLVNQDLHLRSRRSVAELLNFVKLPGGKAGGEGSSHDDCVTSLAIADALLKLRPRGWTGDKNLMEWLKNR